MMNAVCTVDSIKERNGTMSDQTLRLLFLSKKVERVQRDSRLNNINES
jgi:hypothetical protein